MVTTYEVRVVGSVPESVLGEIGATSAMVQPAQTVLRTAAIDQAALYGLISRLRALGLELIEVHRVDESAEERVGKAEP